MSEDIRIIPTADLQGGPLTAGMLRNTAVEADGVWMGEVRTDPGAMSGWHHHGEHTTYAYMISGQIFVEFGPNGEKRLEGGAGDFFVVPPHTVHREGNNGSEQHVIVAIRVGTGQTVFNQDGPDTQ